MKQIAEDYISLETAKLAKEKGFAWTQSGIFRKDGKTIQGIDCYNGYPCYNAEGFFIRPKQYVLNNPHYPRPTQALLAKWLREIHLIMIETSFDTESFGYRIFNPFKTSKYFTEWKFEIWDYEEALEKGLYEALNLIKIDEAEKKSSNKNYYDDDFIQFISTLG